MSLTNISKYFAVIFSIAFLLVIIARWFQPALFNVEVTYWLAFGTVVLIAYSLFLAPQQ